MNIADTLDGATRLVAIIGDPIAQVKSPAGVTQSLIIATATPLSCRYM